MSLVSVIIPTFKGAGRIERALDSVRAQTVPTETVCIVNGPDDGTLALLRKYQRSFPGFRLKIIRFHGSGAGAARNLGLDAATGQWVTMLDDDDALDPEFLDVALKQAGTNDASVICMPIIDVRENDGTAVESTLSARLKALAGKRVSAVQAPWLMGYNAAKLISRDVLSGIRYRPALNSGEDVVFFAEAVLTQDSPVDFLVVRDDLGGNYAYLRTLRPGSRSRQQGTFSFNVEERFDVIGALSKLTVRESVESARTSLIRSQLSFTKDYLESNTNQFSNAREAGIRRGLSPQVWAEFNKDVDVDTLVVSYCFPPFNDPSGVVAAKRIIEEGKVVDCVSADMSAVRSVDTSLVNAVGPFVRKHWMLDGPPSFGDWTAISDFAVRARRITRKEKQYDRLYTRAMWPASHVAGALIRLSNPSIQWVAEFSDPMRFDAEGNERKGPISVNRTSRQLEKAIRKSGLSSLDLRTHFELTEAATAVLASSLILTNQNQLLAMMEGYPSDWRHMIEAKAEVRSHPTLPREYYSFGAAKFTVPREKINVGYFGSFYPNRGLGPVLERASTLPAKIRDRLQFNLFTHEPDKAAERINSEYPEVFVECRGYLGYLDFLSSLEVLDTLLVVDAQVGDGRINPFLPSKYADYAGSETPIWAVVEGGSPLEDMPVARRSYLDDPISIDAVLTDLTSWKE